MRVAKAWFTCLTESRHEEWAEAPGRRPNTDVVGTWRWCKCGECVFHAKPNVDSAVCRMTNPPQIECWFRSMPNAWSARYRMAIPLDGERGFRPMPNDLTALGGAVIRHERNDSSA